MLNYVHKGEILTVAAPYAVIAGAGVKVGNEFGIAVNTQAITENMEIHVVGVFDLVKDTSTFSSGDVVYWDDTNKVATSSSSGNMNIGVAELLNADATAALGGASGDATVRVRLNGAFPSSQGSIDSSIAQTLTVSLTAAQIIAMGTTPITIIPAPGSGKAIIVEEIVAEINRSSTAFTGGGVVHFYYHGLTAEIMAQTLAAASITGASGQEIDILMPVQTAGGSAVTKEVGIDITNATAAFAAGTGTAKLFCKYRTITL